MPPKQPPRAAVQRMRFRELMVLEGGGDLAEPWLQSSLGVAGRPTITAEAQFSLMLFSRVGQILLQEAADTADPRNILATLELLAQLFSEHGERLALAIRAGPEFLVSSSSSDEDGNAGRHDHGLPTGT